jgi:hypothetical protein
VDVLAAIPGTVAVVLGGSHALETSDTETDWDLGLYDRGAIDLTSFAERGTVFPPGSWGRGGEYGAFPNRSSAWFPDSVAGKDAIELGCGTAYVSAWLARRDARVPSVGATTSYPFVTLEWADQWPCEEVWKARKSA